MVVQLCSEFLNPETGYTKIQICFAAINCILKIIHFAFGAMKNKF